MAKEAQVMKGNSQRGRKPGINTESSSKVTEVGMRSVDAIGAEESRQLSPDLASMKLETKSKVTNEMQIDNM